MKPVLYRRVKIHLFCSSVILLLPEILAANLEDLRGKIPKDNLNGFPTYQNNALLSKLADSFADHHADSVNKVKDLKSRVQTPSSFTTVGSQNFPQAKNDLNVRNIPGQQGTPDSRNSQTQKNSNPADSSSLKNIADSPNPQGLSTSRHAASQTKARVADSNLQTPDNKEFPTLRSVALQQNVSPADSNFRRNVANPPDQQTLSASLSATPSQNSPSHADTSLQWSAVNIPNQGFPSLNNAPLQRSDNADQKLSQQRDTMNSPNLQRPPPPSKAPFQKRINPADPSLQKISSPSLTDAMNDLNIRSSRNVNDPLKNAHLPMNTTSPLGSKNTPLIKKTNSFDNLPGAGNTEKVSFRNEVGANNRQPPLKNQIPQLMNDLKTPNTNLIMKNEPDTGNGLTLTNTNKPPLKNDMNMPNLSAFTRSKNSLSENKMSPPIQSTSIYTQNSNPQNELSASKFSVATNTNSRDEMSILNLSNPRNFDDLRQENDADVTSRVSSSQNTDKASSRNELNMRYSNSMNPQNSLSKNNFEVLKTSTSENFREPKDITNPQKLKNSSSGGKINLESLSSLLGPKNSPRQTRNSIDRKIRRVKKSNLGRPSRTLSGCRNKKRAIPKFLESRIGSQRLRELFGTKSTREENTTRVKRGLALPEEMFYSLKKPIIDVTSKSASHNSRKPRDMLLDEPGNNARNVFSYFHEMKNSAKNGNLNDKFWVRQV